MPVGKKRKVGSETYNLLGGPLTKTRASKQASTLRNQGAKAAIKQSGGKWYIYGKKPRGGRRS